MESSVSRFLKHVKETCDEHGVQIHLARTEHVRLNSGTLSNGYFYSGAPPRLAVGMKKPEAKWLPTLVHESCHLDQWVECSSSWVNYSHGSDELFDALESSNLVTRSYIPIWAKFARKLELDCEKRTLKKIIKWSLPINPANYVRAANAYVWFYTMMPELGSWYIPGREPYNDEQILALCPDHFLESYDVVSNKLRKEYFRLMER